MSTKNGTSKNNATAKHKLSLSNPAVSQEKPSALIPSASALPFAKSAMIGVSMAALITASGCATSALLENDRQTTKTVKTTLSEDNIIAFGRPAQNLPNLPSASMVIVGYKNSYVLTDGGRQMTTLLTNLTPKNIQVDNDMTFLVPNNDGHFQGAMKLSYAKLKDEFDRRDYQFFLQNGGQDCTTKSDERILAQRFCFTVPVKGVIYPPVSNLARIQSQYRALSRPYSVSFYTMSQPSPSSQSRGNSGAQKLVLLPFALAFDVITFPLQVLEGVAN